MCINCPIQFEKTIRTISTRKSFNADNFNIVVDIKDVIKLLKLVRLNTYKNVQIMHKLIGVGLI